MNYYTKEGYAKLVEEHERIKDEMTANIIQNYPEMKPYYSKEGYLRVIENQMHDAIIIEETDEYKNWDGEKVIRKCQVDLSIDDNPSTTYKILGHNEGNILLKTLSCDSPFTLALLGHRSGDTMYFDNKRITINSVSRITEKNKTLVRKKH